MTGLTYLDHAATTPMWREAIEAMLPHLDRSFANPSGSHRFAREARQVVDEARDTVAELLGCAPGEIVFTSGGTEADNTAIFGALAVREGAVAACPAAEHHAVLECVHLSNGSVVPTTATGAVDLDALAATLVAHQGRPLVVSVMAVNNEVGTVNDLAAVAAVTRAHGAVLHTDAVQAACWLDLRALTSEVDFLSLSAHKFGGPKGVGVLFARQGVAFRPLLVGGGQERERRSGTHNVAGIVAMTDALRLTDRDRITEVPRVAALRDTLVDGLIAALPGVRETVARQHKVAGSAHVCIEGIENEALLFLLDEAGVCASAASACAAGAMEPSHVLAAMGVPRELAAGALRLTLGRTTTTDDVQRGLDVIVDVVGRLRRIR